MKQMLRSPFAPVALAAVSFLISSSALAQDMYITDCSLGCTNGAPGDQIFCGVVNVHDNEVIEIGFSQPIDPGSLTPFSVRLVDVDNGTSPQMELLVSPIDPTRLLIEPLVEVSGFGFGFTFERNRTYELLIFGVQQGDPGPFITSASGAQNLGRMLCSFLTTEGVLPLARPECVTTPNSVGPGALMGASGSTSLFFNDLELTVTGLPIQSFGVLAVGTGQAYRPVGAGYFCIDGSITRQGISLSNGAGEVVWDLDNTAFGGGLSIALGETWRFQHIYRDVSQGQTTFSASDAMRVTFTL